MLKVENSVSVIINYGNIRPKLILMSFPMKPILKSYFVITLNNSDSLFFTKSFLTYPSISINKFQDVIIIMSFFVILFTNSSMRLSIAQIYSIIYLNFNNPFKVLSSIYLLLLYNSCEFFVRNLCCSK